MQSILFATHPKCDIAPKTRHAERFPQYQEQRYILSFWSGRCDLRSRA